MKFFNSEDFELVAQPSLSKEENKVWKHNAALVANVKLEREGKRVYGFNAGSDRLLFDTDTGKKDTHQALLINIEPIEKKLTGEDHIRLLRPLHKLEGFSNFIMNLNKQGYCLDIQLIQDRQTYIVDKCEHPEEKIIKVYDKAVSLPRELSYYECECGARVEPSGFKEVK